MSVPAPPPPPVATTPAVATSASSTVYFQPLTDADKAYMAGLTDAQKEMFAYLEEVNGQDAYNATTTALGKLDKSKYLRIPTGLPIPIVPIDKVGDPVVMSSMPTLDQARIYAMNKQAFPDGPAAIKGAILRVYLVAAGWLQFDSTYEVIRETPPPDAVEVFTNDWPQIKDLLDDAKKLAYLLPVISENVFRTMGHHYLTSQGVEFEAKYRRAFDACVEPQLASYLPPAELYHTASHWVSLSRALAVAHDPVQATKLPNALVIRSRAAPAGTAIITTSVAVLDALAGTGMKEAYLKAANIKEELLRETTEIVVSNPAQYHTIPTAYGRGALGVDEKKKLEEAKALAISMAPILQGFVDSLPRDCDLSMAKALAKHAQQNPTLRKQAKAFFSEVARHKAKDITELVDASKRAVRAGPTVTMVDPGVDD